MNYKAVYKSTINLIFRVLFYISNANYLLRRNEILNQDTIKKKVLHVVICLSKKGGIEEWLLNVFQYHSKSDYEIHLVSLNYMHNTYIELYNNLGVQTHRVDCNDNIFHFHKNFKLFLSKKSNFDIIHVHTKNFSESILLAAYELNIPTRILQTHANSFISIPFFKWKLNIRHSFKVWWVNKFSTKILAVSDEVGENLLGQKFYTNHKSFVLAPGLSFERFNKSIDKKAFLNKLKLPVEYRYIGHVGRLHTIKNQTFLLDIYNDILKCASNFKLVFIGDGSDKEYLIQKSKKLKISDQVIFLGAKDNIENYFLGLLDVLVFPSKHEGLGRVVIEAQAAGIPSVISSHLPKSLDVVPGAVERVSLDEPAEHWAEVIIKKLNEKNEWKERRFDYLNNSPFSIDKNVEILEKIYTNSLE